MNRTMRISALVALVAMVLTAIGAPIKAGAQQTVADSSLLTVERIFGSSDFDGDYFGPALWFDDSTYTTLEPAQAPATGRDIVRYDAASGRRSIFVPSTSLVPTGATRPLSVESFRLETRLAAQHARRLLGARSRDGPATKARRKCAGVDIDVRQVLARQ
jgi:hypothetical protein